MRLLDIVEDRGWASVPSINGSSDLLQLAALFSTLARDRTNNQSSLAPWRRTTYTTDLAALLALSLVPPAMWLIVLSGVTMHLRVVVLCLLGLNAVAATLIWFGSGWSRLGLTVVAYWIFFLWMFPVALRE